jgi:hypothetical protein
MGTGGGRQLAAGHRPADVESWAIAILSSIKTYSPASYRGGILTLHYARAQEIEP